MWRLVPALVLLMAVGTVARAQPADRVGRVAYVSGGPILPGLQKTLEHALAETGWRTGKNLLIDYRSAEGQYDRLPGIVEDVLRLKPDVIMSSQTPTTQAIRKVTSAIPIVMVGHGDPVLYGLVSSLARPEGNITGVSFNGQ